MAKTLKKGFFITFDGPEGCGKSTQSRRIYEKLLSDGYSVVRTAEPGDTRLGKVIREALLKKHDIEIKPEAELFLFEADRAQHVREVVKPAVDAGKIVICDRFNTATFAYQGYGLGMDLGEIKKIDAFARGGVAPDLTIVLDVAADEGLKRAGRSREADKIEKRGFAFHDKVRNGYLALAAADTERIKVVDASRGLEEVYRSVEKEVYAFIERHKGAK
ncbi:MAG TPA: dTMP kinase [Candidatus Omnitrophota bacterium]|nr:dTMP kinase [Candidatus Omnitrophota bacterium]